MEKVRGPFLTAMAVLFGLLAVSNFTKAFQHSGDPTHLGLVVFGYRFESFAANLILGPLFGLLLGAYAFGLWRLRPWVASLSILYAFYVPVNLVIFWFRQPVPDDHGLAGLIVYLFFALGGSIGTALYLAYHREKLV